MNFRKIIQSRNLQLNQHWVDTNQHFICHIFYGYYCQYECYDRETHINCSIHAHAYRGMSFNIAHYMYAIYFKSMSLLKYLYKTGCPWDSETSKKIDILRMADYGKYTQRSSNDFIDGLKYAHKNSDTGEEMNFAYEFALFKGGLDSLKYNYRNMCTFSRFNGCYVAITGNVLYTHFMVNNEFYFFEYYISNLSKN